MEVCKMGSVFFKVTSMIMITKVMVMYAALTGLVGRMHCHHSKMCICSSNLFSSVIKN